MPRLFIAIEPCDAVLDDAGRAIATLRSTRADVRWAARDHIHVTLRFLGEVPAEDVPALEEMVASTAGVWRPLDLEARGIGSFPPGRAPRVVWMGVQGVTDADKDGLFGLRRRIHDGAAALGLPDDRDDFHPHLTLGRVRGPRRSAALAEAIRAARDQAFSRFEVREIVLIRSVLSRDGSSYTLLRRAPLGAR